MALPDEAEDVTSALPVGQRGEFWPTPSRYGAAEAIVSMGTVAAPLLAGFALAGFVGVLALSGSDLPWRDASLLLMMLASLLLICSVQATFWARQYQMTPGEVKDWWPDWQQPYRMAMIRREFAAHNAGFRRWANLARTSYEIGLLALIAALTMLAVPPHAARAPLRWVAVAAGVIAFCAELCWGLAALARPRRPAVPSSAAPPGPPDAGRGGRMAGDDRPRG